MRTVRLVLRHLAERWPIIIVVPAFAHAGYTWQQALIFGAGAVLLAELVYTLVRRRFDEERPG